MLAELEPHARPGVTITPATITELLTQAIALRGRSIELDRYLASVPGVTLPATWNPLAHDALSGLGAQLNGLQISHSLNVLVPAATAAADQLLQTKAPATPRYFVPGAPTPPESRPRGAGPGGRVVRELAQACTAWFQALTASDGDISRWLNGRQILTVIAENEPRWSADLDSHNRVPLTRWTEVRKHLDALSAAGLEEFAAAARDGLMPATALEDVLRLAVARAALNERLEAAGLDGFDAVQRERITERYLKTGEDVRRQMVSELPAQLIAARSFQSDRLIGRVGELNRELGRKRGGLTIRNLLSQYGSVIGEITPCLLMSPHSVARFLPPGAIDIDLVVYDEASQIKVAEAVGAMGRAKSVVVVGDSKQMPPSVFGGADAEEDEPLSPNQPAAVVVPTDQESILSEAVESNLPQLWLSWHYRSQDESLIAFSNHYYYEGRLASFPGPPEPRQGLGLGWRRVHGSFERGRDRVNRVEAEAIVADIQHRLRDAPETSIGVVTFNTEQRDLVLDLLESSTDPAVAKALEAPEDSLFVKNLENVQGDERDVILFSLAFSPDPTNGKLPLNFGPLNREGGERRLNVAITRARRQVVLFSSFDPEHIELARTSAKGLAHLRDYLTLAARGTSGLATMRTTTVHDLHRETIRQALIEAGLEVRAEVGLSDFTVDLAVRVPGGQHWVAILLDGPGWAGRKTVSDREAVPATVLKRTMGWSHVARVWLPSWLREPSEVVERIMGAARQAASETPGPTADAPAADEASISLSHGGGPREATPALAAALSLLPGRVARHADGDSTPFASVAAARAPELNNPSITTDGYLDFIPADDEPTGYREYLDRLDERRVAAHVRSAALEIVAVEAPIETTRLARIVGRRYGLQRVQGTRAQTILGVVPRSMIRRSSLGAFVWAEDTPPETYTIFRRTPEGVERTIQEIAPEEIANAMAHVARISHGVSEDELFRETAAIFGVRRVTVQIRGRLESTLTWAKRSGRLVENGGRIHER